MNGPVPISVVSQVDPHCCNQPCGMMPTSEFSAWYSRKYGSGDVKSISNVIGSITLVSLIGPSAPLKSESLPRASESNEYFASAAVNGAPLLNSTPERRWKIIVSGLGVSQLVARHGTILPSWPMQTSLSRIKFET